MKLGTKDEADLNDALMERSKGCCEIGPIIQKNLAVLKREGVKPPFCEHRWEHRHHKLRAGQGGDWSLENLLIACFHCHEWVHRYPKISYELGLLIKMSANL